MSWGPRLAIPAGGQCGKYQRLLRRFRILQEIGLISKLPRLIGVQAEGAAPMVKGAPVDNPETVATAIRIGRPVSASLARRAVELTNGQFLSVSDEEILDAQKILASGNGIFAEPASCAPLAGLIKLKKLGKLPAGIRIVMVLTGNGLKDPDAASGRGETPIEIDGTQEALEEALGL